MKNQKTILAICLICFASTFTSCDKEAMFNDQVNTIYEVPITPNEVKIYHSKYIETTSPLPTSNIPIKLSKFSCVNGGTTIVIHHPHKVDMDYYNNSAYDFIWSKEDKVIKKMSKNNSISCLDKGIYNVQIFEKGFEMESVEFRVETNSQNEQIF